MVYYFFSKTLADEKTNETTDEKIESKKVDDKKTNEKMAQTEDPKRAADIETIKVIKQLMIKLVPLYSAAPYCDEAALMCNQLSDEIEKYRIMTLTDEEIVKMLNEKD